MINLWPLLLPAAAWSGWYFAIRNYPKDDTGTTENQLSKEYVIGLNYLLNEQPDKAVDVFIKLLQIDSDTIETHLALGTLFRRRGEVDRAIRIHQNLIARPSLSKEYRQQALLALAQDYMSAGLFDRAEKIFNDVLSLNHDDLNALHGLLSIYQNEASWQQAISIAEKIQQQSNLKLNNAIANFYCELANAEFKNKSYEQALSYLENAITNDKNYIRPYLLLAEYHLNNNNYEESLDYLKQAIKLDSNMLTEIVNPLIKCYIAQNKANEGLDYLKSLRPIKAQLNPVIHIIAEHIEKNQDIEAATRYLLDNLGNAPSFKGLHKLITYLSVSKQDEKIDFLLELTNKLISNKFTYRCKQCGFASKNMHWCCPGCKQWSTLKPIYGADTI
jgi:lipopolysaccharide biosynthesis regulator YciM